MQPEKIDRRNFLSGLLAALASLFTIPKALASRTVQASGTYPEGPRWGMVIDLDKCTACGACVVGCSVENNQMLGSAEEAAMGRVIRWLKILPVTEVEGPRVRQSLIPMPCQQCENPPCTRVCPTSATFMGPDGIVGQVYDRCIGCRYCVNACPYTCKFFNWGDPQWPKDAEMPFNPDVSVREKGVVEKCLFCHHRLQRANDKAREGGRALRQEDYIPACVAACPAQAIVFGNMNDPQSEVAKAATNHRAYRMLEDLGTKPKVVYLREG